MVILIHGNGLVAASQKISQIKKDFDLEERQTISGKETNFDQALIDISTPNLFVEKRLIILEDFDEKIEIKKLSPEPNTTVVLKFNKTLTLSSNLLKQAHDLKFQILNFTEKDEVQIFPFLDALAEKNKKLVYQSLDKIIEQQGSQYLLTMIFFMFRRLINPPAKLPPFILNKIKKQQQNFNIEKLKNLYKAALAIDYKIKSGLIEEKMGLTILTENILD